MVLFAEWPLPILQGLPNSHGHSQKWVKIETSVERQEWMALMGTGVFSPPLFLWGQQQLSGLLKKCLLSASGSRSLKATQRI